MKTRYAFLTGPTLIIATAVLFAASEDRSSAQVLLDDTWADANRGNQELPDSSAWFASTWSSLSVSDGVMKGESPNARLWVTYFTDDAAPVALDIGQTLTATWVVTPRSVAAAPTSMRGLRVGLLDSSSGRRINADGFSTGDGDGAPGAGVRGYMLNMNVATTFTVDTPVEWYERTNLADPNLMGSSAVFTRLGEAGPEGLAEKPAFVNDTAYTLEISATRVDENNVKLTASWNGGDIDVSHSVVDTENATTSFDTLAIRPAGTAQAAAFWDTTQVKVEIMPAF